MHYLGVHNTLKMSNTYTVIKPDTLREFGNLDEILIPTSDVEFTEVLGEGKVSNH